MKMIISYSMFIVVLMGNSKGNQLALPDTLLEYCPYTSFCENSASREFPYSQEYTPCCQPCSCSEMCGFDGNCCHREFDNFMKQENNQPICRSTSTQFYYTSYYKMIDKCSGTIEGLNNSILYNDSISDSKFHPVYSPSKKQTYINEKYAHCNNVTDGIYWQLAIACESESALSDFTEKIIYEKDLNVPNDCIWKYLPPKGFDLTTSKCEPDVIRTCNVSGLVIERDKSWDLCTEFNATFIRVVEFKVQRYGNVFCWLCNQARVEDKTIIIPSMCSAAVVSGGDKYKQLTTLSLMVILDMFDEVPTELQQENVDQCLPNEVFLTSLQNSCRPRKCPFGQSMLNNKCNFYSNQWYGGSFSFLLKLTPLNKETIPMVFFSKMSAGYRSASSAKWLQRGSLKDWHVVLLIRTTEDQTAVNYLIIKVTYPQSSVDPSYLHNAIKNALKETWMLKNGGEQYPLKISLNEVLQYNPVYIESLLQMGIQTSTNQPYVFIPSYLSYNMHLMTNDEYLIFFDSVPKEIFKTGVFLSQLFFCDQIDLLPKEYDFLYATILFKVTNKTIYDASFRNVMMDLNYGNSSQNVGIKSKQIWTVRVCIDEFLDHYNRRDSSCQMFWSCNLILVVSLTLILDLTAAFFI